MSEIEIKPGHAYAIRVTDCKDEDGTVRMPMEEIVFFILGALSVLAVLGVSKMAEKIKCYHTVADMLEGDVEEFIKWKEAQMGAVEKAEFE